MRTKVDVKKKLLIIFQFVFVIKVNYITDFFFKTTDFVSFPFIINK